MDQHTDSRGEHRSVDDDAVPAVEATVTCTCPLYMYAVSSFTCPAHGLIRFGNPAPETVEAQDEASTFNERRAAWQALLDELPLAAERQGAELGSADEALNDLVEFLPSGQGRELLMILVARREAAIRAPLEESRQRLTDAFCEVWLEEVARLRAAEERIRELEAQVASFQYGHDMHCEAEAENAKLLEAHDSLLGRYSQSKERRVQLEIVMRSVAEICKRSGGGSPLTVTSGYTSILEVVERALATSSTEATKEGDAG